MQHRIPTIPIPTLVACLPLIAALALLRPSLGQQTGKSALEEGFRNPPMAARPYIYYMILNGYVDRAHADRELEEYARAGVGGICIFDVGARGDATAQPPAGPAFLGPESVADLSHIIRTAGRLGMEVDLSVASSWDMGGSWVKPSDGSMTLVQAGQQVEGGKEVNLMLRMPALPAETPRGPDGRPVFAETVAVMAYPAPERVPGEFVFKLRAPLPHTVSRVVLYNGAGAGVEPHYAKNFVVSVSDTHSGASAFREVLKGTLQAREGPQEFRFSPAQARFVRLQLLDGHNAASGRMQLAEFEVYNREGENINLNHRAIRLHDSTDLVRHTSALGQIGEWSAANIHDGNKAGAAGSWASGDSAALLIRDSKAVVDVTRFVDKEGRLRWKAPAGNWWVVRYVCTNTGERLKVPSPNSDGLATDHLNADATRRYLNEVIERLRPGLGDLRKSALRDLYLASYEVRGQVWTPGFLEEFKKRRGYDFRPFLPVLNGGRVDSEEITERAVYDFRKTQGELLVDAYYRTATEVAHAAGLMVESEAGGPGPPIHQVPVDSLQALGAVDSVRGEFWPDRPNLPSIWVVKETASAAHIYGKKRVHMEAFTTNRHWQEGPQDLKIHGDRAFTEGMNHVVWHTSAHQPPMAGKPGWVYYAGTHLNQNLPWWPMAKGFLSYLARTSFLLQQGLPVADVLRYYGDQGYNFVMPKEVDPSLGFGYDTDFVNAEVLQSRVRVQSGKLTLPDGMSYEVLALPDRDDVHLAVLQKIEQLVQEGATVVGPKPRRATGLTGYPQSDKEVQALAGKMWGTCDGNSIKQVKYGKGNVVCGMPLRQVLAARKVGPDMQLLSRQRETEVDFIHRRTPEADIYFVRNTTPDWQDIEAAFRASGHTAELWDPAAGTRSKAVNTKATADRPSVRFRLEPEGSVFVVFRNAGGSSADATSRAAIEAGPVPPSAKEVTGPWRVTFTEGPAAPTAATWSDLKSWAEGPEDNLRYFSGIGQYSTELNVPAEMLNGRRRVLLDLGDLWAVGEVNLNGRDLGVVWKQPFRIDITEAVRPGANSLTVRVANNWVNRLVGDALLKTKTAKTNVVRTGTNVGMSWDQVPLHKSGLLGPVRLFTTP